MADNIAQKAVNLSTDMDIAALIVNGDATMSAIPLRLGGTARSFRNIAASMAKGDKGDTGPSTPSDVFNSIAAAIGSTTSNDGSETIPYNNSIISDYAVYSVTRFSQPRNLKQIVVNSATGGSHCDFIVFQDNGNGTGTIIYRVPMPNLVVGINTWNVNTDFAPYIIPANALCGLTGPVAAALRFVDLSKGNPDGGTYSGVYYYPNAGGQVGQTVGFPNPIGGQINMRFTATQLPPTRLQLSPLLGKRIGIFGDSISSGNNGSAQVWSQAWQTAVTLATGALVKMQDARWARYINQWSENYTLTNGVYKRKASSTPYPTVSFGVAVGNTLAQDLANLDVLIIELGTNTPANSFGAITDPSTADTVVGNMKQMLDAVFAAAPTLRVFWVLPYQANPAAAAMATQAQFIALNSIIKQVCMIYGVVAINMADVPINPQTWATYLRDGVHPTDACFANLYGPYIAKVMLQQSV